MPSLQKRLLFSLAGLLSFLCALSAAVATGLPSWLRGTVLCRTGAELVNATGAELDKFLGELSFGLFHGVRVKQCGLGGRATRFSCESPRPRSAFTRDTQRDVIHVPESFAVCGDVTSIHYSQRLCASHLNSSYLQ